MTKLLSKSFLKQVLLVSGLTVITIVAFSLLTSTAGAQLINPGDVPQNISQATGGEGSARALVLNIVNFFLGFLGIIAVIMIIYGGIMYVTAGGDQTKIDNAKKIIMYAIVGIIIVLISFALVNTVIQGAGFGSEA
jgi:hypothetical protein